MAKGASKAASRAAIDASFARMADDPDCQAEALRIAEEYAVSDWEALRTAPVAAALAIVLDLA